MKRRTVLSLLSSLPLALTAAGAASEADPMPAAAAASPYAVSDADLLRMLDYGAYPALAPVQKAFASGDVPGAKAALAAYLRGRTSVRWYDPPLPTDRAAVKWDAKKADMALRGEVVVVTVHHTYPNAKIDWAYNATGGASGLPLNYEWTWQLNRMEWWGDLIRAYRATGDEKYAKLWTEQVRSWDAQNPAPPKIANGVGSAWRTIEAGIRAQYILPESYQAFLHSPSVSDEDLLGLVRVLAEHGVYLAACHTGGNWLTMEMNGLYAVGCLFPELKDAAAWRKQGADALFHEQKVQFLPDGAQYELTPGYHNVALDNVLGIYKRARTCGRLNELPDGYAAGMERAFAYDLLLMTPDRSLPKFNDSWPYGVPNRMADGATLFPQRTDFAFIGSDGKHGERPKELSHAFPYAGYFVMRDGWDRDACMAVLDAGPLGNGHFHQDKLNFVAWPYGRELLYDCGGGSYEQSRYRSYATDTFGHNCVLVDGQPQRRDAKITEERVSPKPIDARWESRPTHDYAEGAYTDGWGDVSRRIAAHVRRALFVKATPDTPPFWIVSDLLTPTDAAEHTYQARWNLLTTHTTGGGDNASAVSRAVATADAGHPNLVVAPLLTDDGLTVRVASAETQPEILGWNVRKDLDPQYVPATTILHTQSGTGPRRFLTLLLPLKAGEDNPITALDADGPQGAKVAFRNGTTVAIADNGARGLEVRVRASGGQERVVTAGAA